MARPVVTVSESNGMKIICVGEPDFRKVPKEKLDRFLDFCMESLDRYYGTKDNEQKIESDENQLQNERQ